MSIELENSQNIDKELIMVQPISNNIEKINTETLVLATANEQVVNTTEVKNVIESIDYESLSTSALIDGLKALINTHKPDEIKRQVNNIKNAFFNKTTQLEEIEKSSFIASGGNVIDFRFENKEKSQFNALYDDFRNKLDKIYKDQSKNEAHHLTERLAITEKLKNLYQNPPLNNHQLFAEFKEIKNQWHDAGKVPQANADVVYKTYHHHLNNFYEYLDLNKEFREMELSHNLEIRKSILKRADGLVNETNVQKALNELQYLHKMWKEQASPVAEGHKDATWELFKTITDKINLKKEGLAELQKNQQEENSVKKAEIINKITALASEETKSHNVWQQKIKQFDEFHKEFLAIGRTSKEKNNLIWISFKESIRTFNHKKNEFYKGHKSEQQNNLDQKIALIKIAKEHQDSVDLIASTQIIKKIQADWKKIGHVPRKLSDTLWHEFNSACNLFFEKIKNKDVAVNQALELNYAKKVAFLEQFTTLKLPSNHKEALNLLNEQTIKWNLCGKIPTDRASISKDFNAKMNAHLSSLNIDKREVDDYKLQNFITQIEQNKDERLWKDELIKVRKTIDETGKELAQLENNLLFFSNAKTDNPIFKDVLNSIALKKDILLDAKVKYKKLSAINFKENEA